MFHLKKYLAEQRATVNKALEAYLDDFVPSDRMKTPVAYCLLGNGKRLRPILCLAANHAVGGKVISVLPAACALEMIHTYSLIHDDLPALDNDEMRRGNPTCHVQFDEATAILTGDALLTMAFEVLGEDGCRVAADQAAAYLSVIRTIAKASGCRGMIEGQARDIAFEGVAIPRKQLQELHLLKTGALIEASVVSGAILGGADDDRIGKMKAYAKAIGLAFQVMDDILNVIGDPDRLGKAVGTDLARSKNTYPALLGLEQAKHYAGTLINDALNALSSFDNKADPLRAIATYIIERNR